MRLTDVIAEKVEAAIAEHAQGETLTWEVSLQMTPQGPIGVFLFFAPAVEVGSVMTAMLVSQDATVFLKQGYDERQAKELVQTAVEQMKQARSQELVQSTGIQGVQDSPASNGSLHLPGQS